MKYEVIKLKTGQELCGMVSYNNDTVEITLPMICQLTKVTATNTLATFIPYNPLGNDSILTIGLESIMHTKREQLVVGLGYQYQILKVYFGEVHDIKYDMIFSENDIHHFG